MIMFVRYRTVVRYSTVLCTVIMGPNQIKIRIFILILVVISSEGLGLVKQLYRTNCRLRPRGLVLGTSTMR